jgi:hypothetical protein
MCIYMSIVTNDTFHDLENPYSFFPSLTQYKNQHNAYFPWPRHTFFWACNFCNCIFHLVFYNSIYSTIFYLKISFHFKPFFCSYGIETYFMSIFNYITFSLSPDACMKKNIEQCKEIKIHMFCQV